MTSKSTHPIVLGLFIPSRSSSRRHAAAPRPRRRLPGHRNISCGICHNPKFTTGDGASLSFGEGSIGLGPDRVAGLRTPMEDEMTTGFTSLLSAQTMFPVLSADEMAGHYSENDEANAARKGQGTGPGGAWNIIAKRVEGNQKTIIHLNGLHGKIKPTGFTDASNTITAEWRADGSPLDAYLHGQPTLGPKAQNRLPSPAPSISTPKP